MKKWTILIILIILLIGFSGFIQFRRVIPASFAKEYCSCIYVEGQSRDFCYRNSLQIIPISSYEVIEEEKLIRAYGLLKTAEARFVSDQYGCVLEKEK